MVTRYRHAAEWLHDLGDVPPDRIIMDPWPGTATEKDLLTFVERDKRLCELIDGTLVEKPMGFLESLVAVALITALNNFVRGRNLGVVSGEAGTLRMASGRIRLPDVAYISFADMPGGRVPPEPVPTLPPTIAAEVLSETNTAAEIRQKLREYFESGCRLAWIIDPVARTVAVYEGPSDEPARVLGEADVLDGGGALPGFGLPVSDLFVSVPRN